MVTVEELAKLLFEWNDRIHTDGFKAALKGLFQKAEKKAKPEPELEPELEPEPEPEPEEEPEELAW